MEVGKRVAIGRGYRALVKEHRPEQFVTLTYAYPFSDRVSEEGLRFFIKALVSSLPRRVRPHFEGVVAAERTIKNIAFDGTYHFHLVVWGLDDLMDDAHEYLPLAVVRASELLVTDTGLRMSQARHSDTQVIAPEQLENVSAYETKDIYRYERPAGAQILFIKGSEVTGTLLTKGDAHHEN